MVTWDPVAHYVLNLFNAAEFPARWVCGSGWDSFTGWFYILSDLGISAAYFAIPLLLTFFVLRRKDTPFPRIFWLFAAFIFACGLTHFFDALMFWWPAYRLSGAVLFATATISWGTLGAMIPIIPQALLLKSPQELEALVEKRTEDLIRSKQEVEQSEARFRRIMDANIIGVFFTDFTGPIREANEAFLTMLGYTPEELHQGRVNWQELTPPEFTPQDQEMMAIASQTGSSPHFEKQYFHKKGHRIDVLISFALLKHEAFNPDNSMEEDQTSCVVLILDITRQKHAERALRESEAEVKKLNAELEQHVVDRTRQLEKTNQQLLASNKELETFSYSVSHDLRTPLRSLDGYSKILLANYSDVLDEEGRNYLSRIRVNSQRMGQLIHDLLNLSRVTRAELQIKPLALSELCQEIMSHFQEQEPDRHVTIQIQPQVTAFADPTLLRAVLENLLGNAWKFTSTTPEARIEFGSYSEAEKTVYYVRDNGVGFDMNYVEKLFGAFQRLHSLEEFSGSGIGLATVQRIILRHGGHVWAEGAINKGATFYFSL